MAGTARQDVERPGAQQWVPPDASVEDLRAAAEVVRDASIRADRLVDSLLLLARSDRL